MDAETPDLRKFVRLLKIFAAVMAVAIVFIAYTIFGMQPESHRLLTDIPDHGAEKIQQRGQ